MRILVFMLALLVLSQVQCQVDLIEEVLQTQQQLIEQQQQQQQRQNSGVGGIIRLISNGVRDVIVNEVLGRSVAFIVHPTAHISPELRQYGTQLGRAPRTQEERDKFIDLMKQVARRTPALMNQYVKKVTTHKNGTITYDFDYYGLDADIIRRALLFQSIRSARSDLRRANEQQPQPDVLPVQPALNNGTVTSTQSPANVTITLLDLLSPQNGTNNQQGPEQFQPVPFDVGYTVTPGYTFLDATATATAGFF